MSTFNNQTVLITGAAGIIGQEIARHFAGEGCNLLLSDIAPNMAELEKLSEIYREGQSIMVKTFAMDLNKVSEIETILADVLGSHKVDILVNNAGINVLKPAIEITEQVWDAVVNVNLKGSFFVSQCVAKQMILGDKGVIVNIASQHGVVGNHLRAPYCASKAGLINLSRALALEWAKFNIRVNCVSPTFVLNGKNEDMVNDEGFKRKNLSQIPLGKYALPSDVAQAVLFLASPHSGMITGQNLLVDGGWTAH